MTQQELIAALDERHKWHLQSYRQMFTEMKLSRSYLTRWRDGRMTMHESTKQVIQRYLEGKR